ncbi:hypothetical protein HBI81_030330 [Parastagonospora nodorum]|nr:hypothetical protein HBH51_209240 [Parastagonospora nodorum]KAH3978175.1 hypothetical protein HBH52_108730 [Parastagonospora nodorum]KAH5260374.1 hypothetical protein HBI72_112370 [Parastagonospora nodorum]KAH5328055.1 hypothetical protein HBI11_001560 [Parastagonospora nodorum]KAH5360884.1 hypothetical protein HBI48_096250 [Parastagonospora nodorum]
MLIPEIHMCSDTAQSSSASSFATEYEHCKLTRPSERSFSYTNKPNRPHSPPSSAIMANNSQGSRPLPIPIRPRAGSLVTGGFYGGREHADQMAAMLGMGDRENPILDGCSGLPPKRSFLGPDGVFASRGPMIRRSTLADRLELDALLARAKVTYDGHVYLPLTAETIHHLLPFFNGSKPIADKKLFEYIMIDHEVNSVHADHVVACLERIGELCKHLLVMSPVHTSELGSVFKRDLLEVSPGNDWSHILNCFPNLERLAFVHPIHEPVDLSRGTFFALLTAVANRQAAKGPMGFKYEVPKQIAN